MIKQYYLITLEEIGDLLDITEDLMIEETKEKMVEIARKRIDLVNLIKTRPHVVHEDEDEPIIYGIEDVRFVVDEPPDYDDCPCWSSPADPEETTGTCEGDWGDCKLWYWNCGNRSYTECDRFAKDCSKCQEVSNG
jgi:hypothetical protein